jgi:protease-4
MIRDLRAARDNDDVEAIVLRIDSPGGSAFASDEIWAEIREVRKVKPVYASMSDVAASGGYYIAMACDTIIAHPSTITGSIGVIMSIPNFTGSVAKVGITIDTVSLGPSASFMNAGLPLTDGDKRTLRSFGQGIYTRFVQKVAESRKMDTAAARKLARGRVWTGTAAKEAGLVDVLGGLDVAIATAKKRIGVGANEDVNVILYPKKVDNLTALLKAIGLNKEDGDEDAEARAMLRSSLIAKVTGTIPASEQIYRALPGGTRSQVKHALQLTELGMTERALMMLPMTVPMD